MVQLHARHKNREYVLFERLSEDRTHDIPESYERTAVYRPTKTACLLHWNYRPLMFKRSRTDFSCYLHEANPHAIVSFQSSYTSIFYIEADIVAVKSKLSYFVSSGTAKQASKKFLVYLCHASESTKDQTPVRLLGRVADLDLKWEVWREQGCPQVFLSVIQSQPYKLRKTQNNWLTTFCNPLKICSI